VSRTLVAEVARESEPKLLTTDATDELRGDLKSMAGVLRSVLAAPLPHPEGAGALYLDSVAERHEFQPGDRELLVAFAQAAGVCLARDAERRRESRGRRRLEALHHRELEATRLVGASAAMEAARDELTQAAETDVTVLITGESGTGKELAARHLHRHSPRAPGTFVAVNCAAIPAELVESELFGHEAGAFSGAARRRLGHFELADGGTLFLDEVGELPLATQGKLLRALQERQVLPLGAERPVSVDFRLVCATNVDLEEAVEAGRFREDLFYRIAVFRARLPPLRDRGDDVVVLAEHFLAGFARDFRRPVRDLSEEARALLVAHPWPGNVRELRNVIEQAVVRERGSSLGAAALRPALGGAAPPEPPSEAAKGGGDWLAGWPPALEEARKRFEREFMERALAENQGNMTATASSVGLSRRGIYDKCEELGIDYRSFR
jgi:DNA-binding NtrC family response regulator